VNAGYHSPKGRHAMSKRSEHTFQFTAGEIAAAAMREAEFHAKRQAWWNAEYQKAATEAKEKGVEVRAYAVSGGERAEMVIDPALQTRINECYGKRLQHQTAADQFRMEAAAYGSQLTTKVYDVDTDDVQHWRLAGGERQE
jgi:hypothetical protein